MLVGQQRRPRDSDAGSMAQRGGGAANRRFDREGGAVAGAWRHNQEPALQQGITLIFSFFFM